MRISVAEENDILVLLVVLISKSKTIKRHAREWRRVKIWAIRIGKTWRDGGRTRSPVFKGTGRA